MELGLGLGVFEGLCMLRLAPSRAGEECLPGDESFETVTEDVVVVVLRMVEGVCIVRFRIDDRGFGLFGDRIDKGFARSIVVDSFLSFPTRRGCKQTNPVQP